MSAINKLVGTLVGTYSGPILVVGGAPGTIEEIAWLKEHGFDFDKCLIISANEHAVYAGLKPHYACVNDDIHSTLQIHQEPRMREMMPGTKLLSRHWWADYRNPQLMACNSGLKALLYAAILGANPIVVIGIQNYSNGLYFHADKSKKPNPNMQREASYFGKQTAKVKDALGNVPVRTVSGPLTQTWPKWNPGETFAPRQLCQLEIKARQDAADTRYVCSTNDSAAFETSLVPKNCIFAVTRAELTHLGHNLDLVDATGWDLRAWEKALGETLQARRDEQARLRRLIAKVRTSRRGIRRNFYDADIVRIIKLAEGGSPVGTIAERSGLPKEQVKFMLETMGLDKAVGPVLRSRPAIDTSARGLASVPGESGGATAVNSGEPM